LWSLRAASPSAICIWLVLHFDCQFHQTPYRFGTRQKIDLSPAPVHFAALQGHLSAVIDDTAQNIPTGTLDRRYLSNLFSDLSGDTTGAIRNAADEMRKYESWRAS
jgi:hypothetical protein